MPRLGVSLNNDRSSNTTAGDNQSQVRLLTDDVVNSSSNHQQQMDDVERLREQWYHAMHEQQAHEERVEETWGEQPAYEYNTEDNASLLSRFTYSWIGDYIHIAADEKLNADNLPPPMVGIRSWVVGRLMSKEVERQLTQRHAWDAFIGCHVTMTNKKRKRVLLTQSSGNATLLQSPLVGVLRYVGYLQRSATPSKLMAGIEWTSAPRGTSSLLFHSGVVDGETLFHTEVPDSATCEAIDDVALLLPAPTTGDISADPRSKTTAAITARPQGKATDTTAVVRTGAMQCPFDAATPLPPPSPKAPSAFMAMIRVHKYLFLQQIPFKMMGDYANLASPVILEYLVVFLNAEDPDWRYGVALIAIIFTFNFIQTLGSQKFYHLSIQSGLIVRGSFLGYVFEKCFTISQKALTYPELNTGRIVNMVSTDVERANDFCWYAMYLWGAPQQLIIAIVLLYRLVGWCAPVSIVAMVVTMPIQGWVAKKQQEFRMQLSKVTDQRVKMTSEFFSGIRVVKYMAWEVKFLERIQEVRRKELLLLKQIQIFRVITSLISVAAPTLVIATVLVLYHVSGHTLTARVVFPTIALLNLMRMPFMMIPFGFTALVQLLVAMKRITRFMEAENERVDQVSDIEAWYSRSSTQQEEHQQASSSSCCQYALVLERATVSAYVPVKLPPILGGTTAAEDEHIRGMCARIRSRCSCMLCCDRKKKQPDDGVKVADEKKPLLSSSSSPATTNNNNNNNNSRNKKAAAAAPEDFYELQPKHLLKAMSLKIPKHKLTVIVGPTGCGKSTLLESMLGQYDIVEGHVYAETQMGGRGSVHVAYVPQQPWIMNATIKNNIIFFSEYEEKRFQQTLEMCQLNADIESLICGVETEIGEKGVNLSGGQRARVSLARAVYAQRDVLLLDDPLSALDPHVSDRIVQECICGPLLANTTRVLCTHQVHVLPKADFIVVLTAEGSVCFAGTHEDYLSHPTAMHEMMSSPTTVGSKQHTAQFTATITEDMSFGHGGGKSSSVLLEPSSSPTTPPLEQPSTGPEAAEKRKEKESTGESSDDDDVEDDMVDDGPSKQDNSGDGQSTKVDGVPLKPDPATDGKLMSTEEKAVGSVPWKTYVRYLEACGGVWVGVVVILIFAITEILSVSGSVWLSIWSVQSYNLSQTTYLYVFLGCVSLSIVSSPLRFHVTYSAMRLASLNMHHATLYSVASAPMRFFDTTPLGRILNRFSRDIDMCDNDLQMSFISVLQTCFSGLSTACVMLSSQPFALAALVPCSVAYYRLMIFYNSANREIRRISSIVKSPLYALLTEALTGIRTLRAYGKCHVMMMSAMQKLDVIYSASYLQNVANRWLGVRIEVLANIIITTIASFAILGKIFDFGSTNVGLLSLGFTMALSITQVLNWIVRQVAAVESDMNSVERLVFYTDSIEHEDIPELTNQIHSHIYHLLPPMHHKAVQVPEPPPVVAMKIGDGDVSSSPMKSDVAVISYRDVAMRYREGLPLVLNHLTFDIYQGDKVGVVGRTGSGKSSLLLSFMRMVDTSEGEIRVLGTPIREYDLHDLRRLYSIIPQEPLLFDGTIRSNLDPFNECTNEEVWSALQCVGLRGRVEQEGLGIDSVVLEQGSNFSVGQRQLLCLARALLRKDSKFILMDEATANIDPGLDKLIQSTVKTAFAQQTVITIAHRLHTILEYRTILVMDAGRVAEVGRPWDLVLQPNSILRAMIASHGPEGEAKLMKQLQRSKRHHQRAAAAAERRPI